MRRFLGVLILAAGFIVLAVFYANPVEFFFLDLQFAIARLFTDPYGISRDIAIVMIDEKASKEFMLPMEGRWSPYYPRLLDVLKQADAGVIAFDIQMSRKEDEGYTALADAFRKADNVITGELSPQSTLPDMERSVRGVGSFSVLSYGGVPRKVLLYPDLTHSRKAFSVLAAEYFVQTRGTGPALKIPEDGFWINYQYPMSYFPVFSFSDVYASGDGRMADDRRTPLSVFRGKIVLVAKESDRFIFPQTSAMKSAGVIGQACAIQTLLDGNALTKASFIIDFFCLAFVVGLFAALFRRSRFIVLFTLPAVAVLFLIQGSILRLCGLWIGFFPILVAMFFLSAGLLFVRQREIWLALKNLGEKAAQLAAYNTRLLEKGRQDDFLRETLVHDIKNSTAVIGASIQFLLKKYSADVTTSRNIRASFSACNEILSLSSNLIDLTRIEAGGLNPEKRVYLFRDVKNLVLGYGENQTLHDKAIRLVVHDPESEAEIQADPYLLKRIIANIMDNAVKYTPKEGIIEIRAIMGERGTGYSFFNAGEPVPESQREWIFEKYVRLGLNRSKHSKGLGLYFCSLAMQAHGGSITLDTSTAGNTFTLHFPP